MRWLLVTARHIFVLVFLAALCFAGNASAEVKFIKGQLGMSPTVRDYPHILIYGKITDADVSSVKAFAPLVTSSAVNMGLLVFLNSPGGDVVASIRIGTFLRDAKAITWIWPGDTCNSACVFLVAAGVKRVVSAPLGLHRPTFESAMFAKLSAKDAEKLYGDLIVRSREYFRDMGIEDKLFSDMLRVPSQKLRMVDQAYAQEVKLFGDDPAHEEWERARDIQKYGLEHVKQWDLLLDCLNSGNSYDVCKEHDPRPSK